ncbi:MAG TPA: plastocyanin/azurin family copper-binding protein [Gaiellaceae bacterium]|jgi:plastocyanin
MYRLLVSAFAAAAVAAALIVVPAWGATAPLKGEVGPGFKIEVEKGGKDLKTIKAGKYKIKVEDKSSIHNFHLIGPGLNKKTSVSFQGQTTWTITLKKGKYTYQCDPHATSGMKGTFRVT